MPAELTAANLLKTRLAAAVSRLTSTERRFGQPELMVQQVAETRRQFNAASSKMPTERVCKAIQAFRQGAVLNRKNLSLLCWGGVLRVEDHRHCWKTSNIFPVCSMNCLR